MSGEPGTRNARENTRRRCASSKHARLGCRYAPRPGCRAWGSGTIPFPATTRRSKLDFAARALHPTQVRTGFFPVSGGSASAVIAFLVYSVAKAGAPSEVRVRGDPEDLRRHCRTDKIVTFATRPDAGGQLPPSADQFRAAQDRSVLASWHTGPIPF